MKNNGLTIFIAIFILSIVSLIGVYAYNGSANMNAIKYDLDVHEQMETAIENGDYDTWIKIRQENNLPMNGRMFQAINKDNFLKYKELHDANLAGDFEKANSIRNELGLGQGMMKGKFNGQSCGSLTGVHNCQRNADADSKPIDKTSCPNYALHHGLN